MRRASDWHCACGRWNSVFLNRCLWCARFRPRPLAPAGDAPPALLYLFGTACLLFLLPWTLSALVLLLLIAAGVWRRSAS